jgi:hypothetical protein
MGKKGQNQKRSTNGLDSFRNGDRVEVLYMGEWLDGVVMGTSPLEAMTLAGSVVIKDAATVRRA